MKKNSRQEKAVTPEVVQKPTASPTGRLYETLLWDDLVKLAVQGLCASDSFEKPEDVAQFAADVADEVLHERRKRAR